MSESTRKRRRLDPSEICQQVYDILRNWKKEDGTLLCDSFIRAPKRRQDPSYYDVVQNPIDLLRIQQKIRTDEYEDLNQFTADFDLLVSNAKSYYEETSLEYKDACHISDLFQQTLKKFLDEGNSAVEEREKGGVGPKASKTPRKAVEDSEDTMEGEDSRDTNISTSSRDDAGENLYEELFTAVMQANDEDARLLHPPFQLLPSKKIYPDYYTIIENPIDLKQIAMKVQANEYSSLSEMEKDLLLMTKNACTYNEPGSQIYKDAKALRKIITAKRLEIEHARSGSVKGSSRIRNKRTKSAQSLSAITAALEYDNDSQELPDAEVSVKEEADEDGDSGSKPEDADDSPFWQLYETILNYTDKAGNVLSDCFVKLPSRRYHPEYYREIKNHMSLNLARGKLVRGDYRSMAEVTADLNLIFDNAKRYNKPDTKQHKFAARLQKLLQSKIDDTEFVDTDVEGEPEFTPKRKQGRPRLQLGSATKSTPKLKTEGGTDPNLRKRLMILYRCLIDFTCDGDRQPIELFMEKPSKKQYPDYYRVITEPIDMITIEANIKSDRYASEEELLDDLRLMFNNCRLYNEEGSMIYEDANMLEKVLMEKAREVGAFNPVGKARRRSRGPTMSQKLKTMYEAVRDFRDLKKRQLSQIFMKLPSKSEYPDYYEVIKKPIDLEKIGHKVKSSQYENVDELLSDLVLMFDNACKYNEPDSQIYKDALSLQRVALQTKVMMSEEEGVVPDIKTAVQELLTSLFAAIYNHQDDEGRCYSDSLAELPEYEETPDGKKVRAISLDLVKQRLDKGMYKRLDMFQEDVFQVLERARRVSRTDSQVFEDATEIQAHFIKQRNEFCRNGEGFSSPALSYTLADLTAAVERMRQEKQLKEVPEEEESKDNSSSASSGGELSFNQVTYHIGDFVYVEPTDRNMEPHIYLIERLWTGPDAQQMFYGNWFCRPQETFHLASRKFLEQEVFKSELRSPHPLSQVRGRCCVLNIKEYLKCYPEGFADKDVYVCESRYSTKARLFKKMKTGALALPPHVSLAQRPTPLEPRRVVSVFRDRIEKHKEELAELGEIEKLPEKMKSNVIALTIPVGEGFPTGDVIYYEQFNIPEATLKVGDCVYVNGGNGKQLVAQIHAMWTDAENQAFFRGPWYVTPAEANQGQNKGFYRQEVFLSSIEDTNPLMSITGKCAVLDFTEYTICRPTEVPENDVYICESLYDESRRQIRKLSKDGLKRFTYSAEVHRDEVYFFRRVIQPQRDSSPSVSRMTGIGDEYLAEDSMDGAPPSVCSDTGPSVSTPAAGQAGTAPKKPKIFQKRMVTGYIIYSGEIRKGVAAKYPEASFGEVSRLVGNEWRNLPAHVKQDYEEKAQRLNEETVAEMARTGELQKEGYAPSVPSPDLVYECCWQKCTWQFEDINDLTEHLIQEPNGHVITTSNPNDTELHCQWRGCARLRKGMTPFPKMDRLIRHVKDVHITKNLGRIIPPPERSKNFVASKKIARSLSTPTVSAAPTAVKDLAMASAAQNPTAISRQAFGEPMFMAVPPKTQRLLHSEAYVRYIEGLHNGNRYVSNWERALRSKADNTVIPDVSKLPYNWLANNQKEEGQPPQNEVVATLWALREQLLKETLGIQQILS